MPTNDGSITEVVNTTSQATIDFKSAEDLAKKFDFVGRDLLVHIDMDFGAETAMNFVVIDPVLFGTAAFVEVVDLATSTADGTFETVEGFQEQAFDKILTPEANKIVDEEIVQKTLAPSQYSYQGLGVFTFPMRVAQKIRATLLMRDPVPNRYQRLHVITQETVRTTVTSTSKRKKLF